MTTIHWPIIDGISNLLDTAGYGTDPGVEGTDPAGVLYFDPDVELLPGGTLSVGDSESNGSVTITAGDTVSVWAAGDVVASAVVPGAYDWYASMAVTAEEVADEA